MDGVLTQIVAFGVGLLSGLAAPLAARWWRRLRAGFARNLGVASAIEKFDSRVDGYWNINRWSSGRPLRRENLEMRLTSTVDPSQGWCDAAGLAEVNAQIPDRGGPSYTLVDYEIDHRETRQAERFRMTVRRSDFGDYVAAKRYFEERSDELQILAGNAALHGVHELVKGAPPSIVGMHVNVVTADGRFLIVERSGAVREHVNMWTVGPGETITAPEHPVPGVEEGLFELGERALLEEVGLHRDDYRRLHVSWLGTYLDCASTLAIGHVYTHLQSFEVDARMRQSHSLFEAETWEWIPLNRRGALGLFREMEAPRDGAQSRRWHASSRIVLQELWRYRPALEFD